MGSMLSSVINKDLGRQLAAWFTQAAGLETKVQ